MARRKGTSRKSPRTAKAAQAKGARTKRKGKKREIEQYDHAEAKRLNNPEVGLVTASTDPDKTPAKKKYEYDPHLDPQLQWAGKKEHTSFEVDSVSLHVHERIDPRTIIEAIKRKNGGPKQTLLFERPSEKLALREAIDFYRHAHGWSNRLVAGDSLLVMNSLLEKEGLGGQVQMVYIDPPYGIKYGSNFQPFVNKREVKDHKDEDLTQEPETLKAFRDTWELGIHSYLTYLRDRLLLAKGLLKESGSCFVQISDENLHHVRELMDEVFEPDNFCGLIAYRTTGGQSASLLSVSFDYLVWYAKNKKEARTKFRQPRAAKSGGMGGSGQYTLVELRDGSAPPRPMTEAERANPEAIPNTLRILAHDTLYSQGAPNDPEEQFFEWKGVRYQCPMNSHWKPGVKSGGMQRLADADRLMLVGSTLRYKRYLDDYPVVELDNVWNDTAISGFGRKKEYVVETSAKVVERCILMATDPGDLVFDPTCGSGTTAHMAENWGRRWITCDSSRVAIALTKQRLMTASYDYFQLAQPDEGIASGLNYRTVPHVMLSLISNNTAIKPGMSRKEIDAAIARHAPQETLYDRPKVDKAKVRVTGPFTVEAVPAQTAVSPDELARGSTRLANLDGKPTLPGMEDPDAKNTLGFSDQSADTSIARSGETLRQSEWRDELLKSGIRAKGGRMLHFSRVEPLAGTRYLHADAETKGDKPERVVISFGPEHAPLEQTQVENAWREAYDLVPRPKMVLFASFQFDPEAAKDIDELDPEKIGMQVQKVQMNTDLLTDDLKKKRSSNESFWFIGQPDVTLRSQTKQEREASADVLRKQLENDPKRLKEELAALKEMYVVEVAGFDYYDPRTGKVEAGGPDKIAMWMLDPDYNGRSLYPRQVFFPMAGKKEGWARLAKSLKAELDEDLIEAYRGTVSLPFTPGPNQTIAVKIIDDRGIESLRVMEVQ